MSVKKKLSEMACASTDAAEVTVIEYQIGTSSKIVYELTDGTPLMRLDPNQFEHFYSGVVFHRKPECRAR